LVDKSVSAGNSDPYRGLKKEKYIQALNLLRSLPKLLLDYLKSMPEPVSEAELTRLAQQGFIQKIRNLYRLTPSGNTALARTSVNGEKTSLNAMEIAYLQSLTFLPTGDKTRLLEQRDLIYNRGGQFVLTPLGIVAKSEVAASLDSSHRLQDILHNLDEDELGSAEK
jgi:DNA-binding PadR family transcriptional regulator